MSDYIHVMHEFEPVYDKDSKVLILGSLPSVKSREQNFYYGHPSNRFWKLIAIICDETKPETISEKKELLIRNKIAVWDVISECDIVGSSDSSIKNVIPTDLSKILDNSDILKIYANGSTAAKIYNKYQKPLYNKEIEILPSTSPANAAWSIERLYDLWKKIKI